MALVSGSLLGLAALGKLVGGVKTAGAIGAATKLGAGKVLGAAGTRMAGGKLAGIGKTLAGRVAKSGALPRNLGEAVPIFGPDMFVGGLTALQTPGDLGDKLIAGGMTGLGGAVGGVGLRGMVGSKNMGVNIMAEMAGGVGGDMLGQGTADSLLRIKGGGTTPYEKLAADQQKELEQQILQRYLSGKGGYPMGNGVA